MPLIIVRPDGVLHLIYRDDLLPLLKEGQTTITRASNVEPTAGGRWQADMAPVDGPVLEPCETRQQALDAEVQWIEENRL